MYLLQGLEMDRRFKELIWLTKEEAEMISTYLRLMYVWNPKSKEIFDKKDIEEMYNVVCELSSCIVAVNLTKRVYNQIYYLVNIDMESVLFKDVCNDLIFEKIKEKVKEYKIVYMDQT